MRIVRGKSFEDSDGNWNKIEIELTDSDLTSEELKASENVKPVLLELRAETYMISFMVNNGAMTPDKAQELMTYFSQIKAGIAEVPTLNRK